MMRFFTIKWKLAIGQLVACTTILLLSGLALANPIVQNTAPDRTTLSSTVRLALLHHQHQKTFKAKEGHLAMMHHYKHAAN